MNEEEERIALSGIWTHVPLNTGRVWWPLHYQDNHAGNAVIVDSESARREYPRILSAVRWESL